MLSLSSRTYLQRPYDESVVVFLVQKYGLKEIQARLIAMRGFEDDVENFLNPKVKNLMPNPSLIKGINNATKIVLEALIKNKKILIWGDYDVDGICSTSLLVNYFNEFGISVNTHIPDRFEDGYGVKIEGVKRLTKLQDSDLIIMVDCGSNDNNSIEYIKSLRKQIIIIDHHLIKGEIPQVDAFINNKQEGDLEDTRDLCATAMVFMFLVALNREIQKQLFTDKKVNMLGYLDLVALATVCDVVPLKGLNRAFVKTGTAVLQNTLNKGLKTLMNQLGIKNPSASDIGFQIGPSINAAGRLDSPFIALQLLNSNTPEDEIINSSNSIIELNSYRKAICNHVFQEAIHKAIVKNQHNFILLWSNEWHEGIIGIVASKIKELFQKPCCIVSFKNNLDIGKGSGRSTDNFDLGKAITSASELLVHGGGHKKAVGFSVMKENIQKLELYLLDYTKNLELNLNHYFDATISLDAISIDFYNDIISLEPFGESNPEPIFKIDNIFIKDVKSMGENHISCTLLNDAHSERNAVAFNIAGTPLQNILMKIDETKRHSIIGRIIKNQWSTKVSILINDII